jgi:glutathione peroxidase
VGTQRPYTPQYAGLQELWKRHRGRGLLKVGVPSDDFGGQELGTAADIAEAAQYHYGATFPITAKAEVRGPNSHPFYKWAAGQRPLDPPRCQRRVDGSAGDRPMPEPPGGC